MFHTSAPGMQFGQPPLLPETIWLSLGWGGTLGKTQAQLRTGDLHRAFPPSSFHACTFPTASLWPRAPGPSGQ